MKRTGGRKKKARPRVVRRRADRTSSPGSPEAQAAQRAKDGSVRGQATFLCRPKGNVGAAGASPP